MTVANTQTEWQRVLQEIQYDDIGKVDWTLPADVIRMNPSGRFGDARYGNKPQQIGETGHGVIPNEHALSQFASRLGIPAKYAKKCYEEDPSLIAHHFNYWLGNLSDEEKQRQLLLRGKGDSLRAVLTDKYAQLDNAFVFDALAANLSNGSAVDVKNFALSDKYLNLRLVFPDLSANVGTFQKKDQVMVGIHITNSEVGSSSLRIDSCLFRLVCENGMIARVGGDSLMQQRHVHLTRNEMENRVADAISESLRVGDGLIEDFARTQEIAVKNPLKVLEDLAKKQKYSEDFTKTLKESFATDPSDNVFGVINSFTHAAKALPFDRRLEVETFAGRVMQDYLQDSHKMTERIHEPDGFGKHYTEQDLFEF